MDLHKFNVAGGGSAWIDVEAVVFISEADTAGLSTIGLSSGARFVVEGTLDATHKAVTRSDRITP
jgi:hypothetical protein